LIGQFRIVDRRQAFGVPISQHASKFQAGRLDPAWHHQGGIAKIDEADLPARLDPPAVTEISGQTGLSSMGDPGVNGGSHSLHCM
jgi:hypothetical protein